jgi:hypothetical protein
MPVSGRKFPRLSRRVKPSSGATVNDRLTVAALERDASKPKAAESARILSFEFFMLLFFLVFEYLSFYSF